VVPPIRALEPCNEESVRLQIEVWTELLTKILPPVLTDSARQAVLIRNAAWVNQPPERPVSQTVTDSTVRTRHAVLAARSAFERAKSDMKRGIPLQPPAAKMKKP
jgi:predicted metal-dependent hydrolase